MLTSVLRSLSKWFILYYYCDFTEKIYIYQFYLNLILNLKYRIITIFTHYYLKCRIKYIITIFKLTYYR